MADNTLNQRSELLSITTDARIYAINDPTGTPTDGYLPIQTAISDWDLVKNADLSALAYKATIDNTALVDANILGLDRLVVAGAEQLLIGRQSGSGGSWEEITLGTNLSIASAVLNANDAEAFHDDIAGEFAAVTGKATVVDADIFVLEDSGAANVKKIVTATQFWTNYAKVKADALYSVLAHTHTLTDVTDSGALAALATVGAAQIDDEAVTLAKQAHMATASILGRSTAATGDVEVLSAATTRTLLNVADGANAYVHPNHSGDVTSVADGATTIVAGAVTLAMMADIATDRLIGRDTAGTGVPEALTVGGGVEFTTSGGIQRSALTGAVAAAAGSATTSLNADAVDAITEIAAALKTGADGTLVTGTAGSTNDLAKWNVDGDIVAAALISDDGTAVKITKDIQFTEQADHASTPGVGFGYLWVKSTDPSTLIFTGDTGLDTTLGSGGGASQLTDLSDVNTATVTDKFVLVADGVDFESRALVEADISDLGTYITASVTTLSSLVTVGALNSGSITSGFGNIDIGASTLGVTGTVTGPSGTWDAGGMDIAASDSYAVAGTAILSDSAGTMTLSNVDALDSTTADTIAAALVNTPNRQTGTTYTVVIGDAEKIIEMNNAATNVLTIPLNSSVAFVVGTIINVVQYGAGVTTVTGATSVTVNGVSAGGAVLTARYGGVSLHKTATDEWIMVGSHGVVA